MYRTAVKDKIEATREDFRQFKEKYRRELEEKLNRAVEITEKFAGNDATPHNFNNFIEKLDAQILDIAQSFQLWEEEVGSSLADSAIAVQLKTVNHKLTHGKC